jgi:hypothetical protein
MTIASITADQILDRVHVHVRKHLAECKGRTRYELELMFADLRTEATEILENAVAEILENASIVEEDES